jgi:hypothetical protein
VQVRRDRDRSFLIGGVDDAEQRLGRVRRDRKEPDIVDQHQIDADQLPDRLVDAVIDAVAA